MKIFIIGTSLGFILLTVLSLQIHTTDSVTLYGYPKYFYKHEVAIPSLNEYESHLFIPTNFVIDLICASGFGLGALGLAKVIRKVKHP